jgi:hypothetical protein
MTSVGQCVKTFGSETLPPVRCPECDRLTARVYSLKGDLNYAQRCYRRDAANYKVRPSTIARRLKAVQSLRQALREAEVELEGHRVDDDHPIHRLPPEQQPGFLYYLDKPRVPQVPQVPLILDPELVAEVTTPETREPTLRASPNGRCHECDRPVSGERRLCGRCLSHRKV